jgi:hypothetical protein
MSGGGRRPSAELRSGHVEISWSIALDMELEVPVDPADAATRLQRSWPGERLGPTPTVKEVDSDGADRALADLADAPYVPGEPICRVAIAGGSTPRLLVTAHHGALDGLGMLAVAQLVLDEPLRSGTRGVDPDLAVRTAGHGYLLHRLAEALVTPPARFAPRDGRPGAGDHLVSMQFPAGRVGTATLASAAARTLLAWNAGYFGSGRSGGRIVVAVGASRRPGSEPSLEEASAWFRIRLRPGHTDPEAVRNLLRETAPEPRASPMMEYPLAGRLARALAGRTGSSVLVTNLGRLVQAGPVRAAALYPSVHGRSGVGIGGVTVGPMLTLTVRARRRDFSREAARAILTTVADLLVRRSPERATRREAGPSPGAPPWHP